MPVFDGNLYISPHIFKILLLIAGDIHPHPGPPKKSWLKNRCQNFNSCNRNTDVISYEFKNAYNATHNQGDQRRYGPLAGNQCCCNSLISLVLLPHLSTFNSNTLDNVLKDGDELYKYLKALPQANTEHLTLEYDELPTTLTLRGEKYSVNLLKRCLAKYDEDTDAGEQALTTSAVYIPLQNALHNSLTESNKILIMVGGYSISLFFTGGFYFVFDPHARDSSGRVKENGKAVLMKFSDFKNTLEYLKYLRGKCTNSTDSTITFQPVRITNPSSTHSHLSKKNFFESYLIDQAKKNRDKIQTKKSYSEIHPSTSGIEIPHPSTSGIKSPHSSTSGVKENNSQLNSTSLSDAALKKRLYRKENPEYTQKGNERHKSYMKEKRMDPTFKEKTKSYIEKKGRIPPSKLKKMRNLNPTLKTKGRIPPSEQKEMRKLNPT